jgi:uncharacterized protein (UPF0332 family)
MTWSDLQQEREAAAGLLKDRGLNRDAVNRIYYSVHYRVVAEVSHLGPFKGGVWANPPHNEIPSLISRLPGYSNEAKREMRSIFKEVFKKRVDADYRPGAVIDTTVVKEVFRKSSRFKELINHEA